MDRFYAYMEEDKNPIHIQVKGGVVQDFQNCSDKLWQIFNKRYANRSMKLLKGDFDYIIPAKVEVKLQIIEAFMGKIEDHNKRISDHKRTGTPYLYLEGERTKLVGKVSEYEQKILFETERIFITHGFIYKPK
jgi:hypothetical protein